MDIQTNGIVANLKLVDTYEKIRYVSEAIPATKYTSEKQNNQLICALIIRLIAKEAT